MQVEAIRKITIHATNQGVDEATASLGKLSAAHKDAAASAQSASGPTAYEQALAKQQRAIETSITQMKQLQEVQRDSQGIRMSDGLQEMAAAAGAFAGQLTVTTRQGRELTEIFLRPMKNVVMDNVIAWALWRSGMIATAPEISKFSGSLLENNIQLGRLGLQGGQVTGMLKKMGDDFVQIQPPMKQSVTLTGQFSAVTGTLANQFGALAPQVSQASAAMQILSAGGMLGAIIVGLTAAATAAKKFADSIIETGQNASFANINLNEYQRTQKALEISGGLSKKSFASGTEGIAKNLFDAGRESNNLEKLLKANNIEFERGGRVTLGTVGAIKVMADLIQNATEGAQKLRVAQAFGVDKEWVRAVEQGGDAIQKLIDKMPKAGSMIDTEMIEKAKTFEREWNKALSDMLTAVEAWALDAGRFLNLKVKISNISTRDEQDFADIARAGDLMMDPASWQGKNDKEMDAIIDRLKNSTIFAFRQMVDSVTEQWQLMFADKDGRVKAAVDARIADIKRIADAAQNFSNQQIYLSPSADKGLRNLPAPGDKSTKDAPPKATTDARDQWQRYVDQVERASAGIKAETETIGLNVQAHKQLKIQLEGVSVLKREGVKDTAERRAELEKLAKAAGDAALALERVKIGDKISFGKGTAFLTPEDVHIANELKDFYGRDIPAALASTEAAALRANAAMSTVSNQISGGLTTALTDIAMGTKSAGDAFRNFAMVAIKAIEEMIIKLTIIQPLMRGIQSGFGGGGGLSSLFGGGASTSPMDVNNGYVPFVDGGGIVAGVGHTGGMIGSLSDSRTISPAYFDDAPRFHTGGLVGGERAVIAKDGEEIGWPDKLAQKYGNAGGGNVVTLHSTINVTVDSNGSDNPAAHGAAIAAQVQPAVERMIDDRLQYHLRDRGMLNRAQA